MGLHRRRGPSGAVGTLVVLAALTVGCGDDEPAAGTQPATATDPVASTGPSELTGKAFVVTGANGYEPVPGSQIRVSFDERGVGGTGGCNSFAGPGWEVDAEVLRLEGSIGMTEMACDPTALMDQDEWWAEFISSTPTVASDDDTLTLSNGDVTITLVDEEVAQPNRELEGTTWVLEGIIDGDAVSSVPTGTPIPTLTFTGDDLAVDTGCNTGGGTYSVDGDELTVSPLRLTRMACAEPAGNELERNVLRTVDGPLGFEIDADVLTLTSGQRGLTYRAMDSAPPATS
ncbi:MAG: META domain-containing protein [Actinomycetota bacterium]|nr:META domain-containing protein [Actinomycetota bacterium]